MLARVVAWLMLAAIGVTLVIGAVGPASWAAAIASGGPACLFRLATGVDCPLCGMTRATLAIGHGDWAAAFGFHPLAPFVLAGVTALFVVVALGRSDRLLAGHRGIALGGALVAVGIVRWLV